MDEHQAVLLGEGFLERPIDVGRLVDAHAHVTEALAQLGEIRQRVEISVGFPVPVDELLPLADHTQITVVEIDDLDRQAVLLGGGQLLNAHDDAALAGDAGDLRIRIGELHAHGGRQFAYPAASRDKCGIPGSRR